MTPKATTKTQMPYTPKTPIAIIGMGCIFPKSRNLKEFWKLVFNGIDAITQVPEDSHWRLKDYFSQDPDCPDHVYCNRGGFLPDIAFNPLAYGIPPKNIDATDTSQLLSLEVVRMALADAGYPEGHTHLKEKRVNVILGVTGTQELVIPLGARLGHPFWKEALDAAGIAPEKKERVLKHISNSYVSWQENSFPGLLGNVVAGRIANRLDLSGTNTVCDAACASSLSAIHTAMMELETGHCDMSITGGVDTLNDIFMHMCFAKTGVLSHSSDARPFSENADGTVLGEGVGLLVLKRLEDAQRDQDRIYAVIKGMGTSSDGRTSAVYAPESKGQIKALENAYNNAGILPESVGLIEAHGTGTRVGDKVEFTALKQFFKDKATESTAIGSVKSMIGHTKAASGAAGIIKAALALHHKIIPPTLKAQTPDPDLDIHNSPFYLNQVSKPWIGNGKMNSLRCSGVSAFGFGGSNFHAVLEEYTPEKTNISWDGTVQIIALSGKTEEDIIEKLDSINETIKTYDIRDKAAVTQAIAWQSAQSRKAFSSKHEVRLLILLSDQDDVFKRISQAKRMVNGDQTANSPIFFGKGVTSGKLGFVFPGQGSQYTGMGGQIMSIFPESLHILEMAQSCVKNTDAKNDGLLSAYMYPPPEYAMDKKSAEAALRQTRIAQPAIGAVSLSMLTILSRFKVAPQMTCGHSYGELCALYSAGWIDAQTCLELSAARGNFMDKAGQSADDPGSMLAIQAPIEKIEVLLKEEKLDLVLANKNSPVQGVLSGKTQHILNAEEICKKRKMRAIKLPVAAAFHSRLVSDAAAPFNALTKKAAITPTQIKVLSNTTGSPYPEDSTKAQDLLGQQLIYPVDFVGDIKQMHEQGVDTFVEVGPKSVLCGLIKSILKDQDVQTIALDKSAGKNSGIQDLGMGLCTLAALGHPVDLSAWEEDVVPPESKKFVIMINGANSKPPVPEKTEPKIIQTKQTPIHASVQPSQARASQDLKNENIVQDSSVYTAGSTRQKFSTQGNIMTSFPHPEFNDFHAQPMSNSTQYVTANPDILVQGLNAMQQLQAQTARAHEKFLETQTQASQALAALMSQTRGQAYAPTSAAPMVQPPAQAMPNHQAQMSKPVPTPPIQQTISKPVPSQAQQPQPQPQPQPQSSAASASASASKVKNVLFEIVSRLTGFPVEMLEPEMDIESDLGVDSIKKVEIISELEKIFPDSGDLSAQRLGSVKTLEDICTAVETDQAPAAPEQTDRPIANVQDEPKNTQPAQSQETALGSLVNIISELTGFPQEMLEPEMNLESDLGIDSIKRVEILSRLEQEQPDSKALSPDDMGSLKTIADIINYLTPEQTTVSKETPKKKTSHDPISDQSRTDQAQKTKLKVLGRQEIELTAFPAHQVRFYNGAKIQIPADKTIYLTRDSAGIATAFEKEFKKLKLNAKIIDATLKNIPDLPNAAGLVLIPDAFCQPGDDALAGQFLLTAFSMASKNGPYLTASAEAGGSFMTCISFLGGGFGFKNFETQISPVYGGMAGLAKTAALEWKTVLCRALDLPFDPKAIKKNAEAAVAMMMTRGAVEMGLDSEHCYIPELVSKPVGKPLEIDLDKSDVVVISGGAKGVTAACAIALAKQCRSKIALWGRSKPPFDEPVWLKGMDTPAEMKKTIFANAFEKEKPTPTRVEAKYRHFASNRAIKTTLKRIQKCGNEVAYYCVDIRDKDLVNATTEKVIQQLGPITALIHGAGVLEDKLICEKTPDQFKNVFETKINGLFELLSSVDQDKLKYLVMFSSVAARFGNTGQCDYAMANEVLNKIAQAKQFTLPHCRAIAINWGPWDGGMVTDALKREFEKRQIELIPIQAGAQQMVAEMGNADGTCVEVVVGGTIPSDVPEPSAVMNKVLVQTFSNQDSCIIEDHKIDNAPVVPLALMVDLLACGAEKNNPGLQFAGMEKVQLLKGIVPGDGKTNVQVDIGKCVTTDHQHVTPGRITSSGKNRLTIQHARAQVLLAETLPQPPILSKSISMDLDPWEISMDQAYQTILFHEGDLQCVSDICGVSSKGIEVMTTTAPDISTWYKTPHAKQWGMDPMVLDAAFQAAILWTFHNCGQVCLPASFANLRLFHNFPRQSGHQVRILFAVNHQDQHKIKGYFTFFDENKTVIASMMGFEAIVDPGLLDKFKSPPLFDRDKILAFAQGNPSDAFGDPYKIFDKEREIARLPKPPYFFMDAVTKADHPAWQTAPGGWIESTYKIDKDAWYFAANHSDTMPFCILLEVALQPCGWLAAYGGAALTCEDRLHFRNLGGKSKLIKNLTRTSGTVKIRVKMTDVSKAGGMIIQNFDMDVQNKGESVYTGTTNFGFFTADALSKQVGIKEPEAFLMVEENSRQSEIMLEDHAPLTPEDQNIGPNTGIPGKALRMIDKITFLDFKAGLHGQGLIQGEKQVDPDEWFFQAHFYQDPVCPGSLGIESFLQLIRFFMIKKFDLNPEQFTPAIVENHEHEWTYRGQIIPSNSNIVVQAHISACTMDETGCRATADGTLCVDGICIYEMKNFCFDLQALTIETNVNYHYPKGIVALYETHQC